MRWNSQPPFDPPTFLDRIRLRRAALRYAEHGWTVVPGAYLAGHRFVCGRAGCPTIACHPALEEWEAAATTNVARVAAWWRQRPHSVLLATGTALDVLDVPNAVGQRMIAAIDPNGGARERWPAARGPVAVTPGGRWMFLIEPDRPHDPELDRCPGVVHHSLGSWIPAAPSRTPDGPVRWVVAPEETGWRLADAETLQRVLRSAIGMPSRGGRGARLIPRQLSAMRPAA